MKTQPISDYEQQAIDFLSSTNTKLDIEYLYYDYYFAGDDAKRDVYRFTLTNDAGLFSGTFGDSLNNSGKGDYPSNYDILASLDSNHPGSFDDFCADFGYNDNPLSEYPKVMKIYQAVVEQVRGLHELFTDEQLDQLADIN